MFLEGFIEIIARYYRGMVRLYRELNRDRIVKLDVQGACPSIQLVGDSSWKTSRGRACYEDRKSDVSTLATMNRSKLVSESDLTYPVALSN